MPFHLHIYQLRWKSKLKLNLFYISICSFYHHESIIRYYCSLWGIVLAGSCTFLRRHIRMWGLMTIFCIRYFAVFVGFSACSRASALVSLARPSWDAKFPAFPLERGWSHWKLGIGSHICSIELKRWQDKLSSAPEVFREHLNVIWTRNCFCITWEMLDENCEAYVFCLKQYVSKNTYDFLNTFDLLCLVRCDSWRSKKCNIAFYQDWCVYDL